MKNSWNHFAIVLYLGGIILLCLFAAGRQKEEQEYAWQRPAAAVETPVSTPVVSWQEETVYGAVHMPKPDIAHRYVLDGSPVEPAAGADGMLKTREIAESRYYNAPSGEYDRVFHKENGIYDRYIYGTGTVGDLDTCAEYIFRYDRRTGKAASFVQEQHLPQGGELSTALTALYAANTGNLLNAVFADTDVSLSADKRKIEELALYFFTSYIPAHPVVPAVIHFRLPAYILSFIMDTDVFITMISPEKLPSEYISENGTD